MRIIVDVMGGDNAPDAIALGAIEAAKEEKLDVVLVGRGEAILQALKDQGIETLPKGVEIANADDVVDMHDDPAAVIKTRKNSSMLVGLQMLKDGGGDAFVSAGSTGALLTAATLIVKRIKGVRRAAMGPVLPTKTGGAVLIDCGANVECTAEYLLQFAYMGKFYTHDLLGCEDPRIGLLNIGAEETKGTELQKQTYALLKEAHEAGRLNFVGNVEARDVFSGNVDVLVCDGFSGNVLLKCIEGTAMMLMKRLKGIFYKNTANKLAAAVLKKDVYALKSLFDPSEVGGTALLGISKPVIKAHGSSDARAIRSAVRQAITFIDSDVIGSIEKNVAYMRISPNEGE